MYFQKLPSGSVRVIVKHEGQRRTGTRPTKGEARLLGAELLLEMGATPAARSVTVAELLATWFAATTLSVGYRDDAERVVERLPVEFTKRRLAMVTPSVIEGLYRQLEREGWSPHRVTRAHGVLSSAYTLALRYEWAIVNPFRSAKKPSLPEADVVVPTPDEVEILFNAADPRFLVWLAVSSELGSRRGENVALQWPDFSDDAIEIHRARAYSPKSGVVTTAGKIGAKGHRKIAITEELATVLRAHRIAQVEMALASGMPSPVWIFSHDAGVTPWRPDFTTREFARLRAACGVSDKVKQKDLRGYVASQLLAAGIPLFVVSKRLGHRQQKTTSDRYGKYVPAADQAAADVMAALRSTSRDRFNSSRPSS